MNSCHSILECYNPFSGVKLSIRSRCFISWKRKYSDTLAGRTSVDESRNFRPINHISLTVSVIKTGTDAKTFSRVRGKCQDHSRGQCMHVVRMVFLFMACIWCHQNDSYANQSNLSQISI